MRKYTPEKAVEQMNRWGQERQPFLFLIDYDRKQIYADRPEQISTSEVLYDFGEYTNRKEDEVPSLPSEIRWETFPPSLADYALSFRKVKKAIYAGNSYLVNLTCCVPVTTNLTLPEIFYHSAAPYKLWMKDRFTVFSPERFVRIVGDTLSSYPMKGTIDASVFQAREKIRHDPKETAEHATIVDLIRNDLSQVATEVKVVRFRYIDEIQTHRGPLLQVSSEIAGKLPEGWRSRLGTLLFRLLPAGSITGAPKKKTLEIIAEAETYPRGFYTGVMGYFDGCDLDSAVMIRFLEQTPAGLVFKSGGGITSQSDLVSEYNEMKRKIYVPIYRNHPDRRR